MPDEVKKIDQTSNRHRLEKWVLTREACDCVKRSLPRKEDGDTKGLALASRRHVARAVQRVMALAETTGMIDRARRVVAGQYGVGLLGFWAIGPRMELRSRVLCVQADEHLTPREISESSR